MAATTETTREIETALEAMIRAYREKSTGDLMACFAPDADVVLYGTGGDEKRVGPAEIRLQAERDWSQADSVEMAFSWRSVGSAGDVAWVAADGAFNLSADGQAMSIPARASFVFERRDGRWLIVHSHFSTPATGQEQGSSF